MKQIRAADSIGGKKNKKTLFERSGMSMGTIKKRERGTEKRHTSVLAGFCERSGLKLLWSVR